MKRIALLFLAAISLACGSRAATRPRYGGTLRVAMQSAPAALEVPALSSPAEYWDVARVLSLVGDGLVRVDALGRPQPGLSLSWQSDSGGRHWQFNLRHGLTFHDGSAASPAAIAQILGALHPDWSVRASGMSETGDWITIDTETSSFSLLAELALPRNLILRRDARGIPIGTGAFRMTDFQPGKSVKLVASEEYWSGRPYVDAIEIEFGRPLRDQALSLELGKTDVIEAAPMATAASPRARPSSSLPVEFMALVSTSNSRAQDAHLREALALSIDRKPIQSVLLKGAAEPTASILPNWMTGYSALFPTQPNLQRAKALLAESRQPALKLSYDPRDPQAQLIAERIALNAREAGIAVQVSLSGGEDLRLVRIALPSSDPALSLREAARQVSLSQPILHGNSVEDLYQAERAVLDGYTLIPLFHIPVASLAGARVQAWTPDRLGGWNLEDVWLEDGR